MLYCNNKFEPGIMYQQNTTSNLSKAHVTRDSSSPTTWEISLQRAIK